MPINDQRIRKTNLGYLPTDSVNLKSYVIQLEDVIKTLRYGGENVLHTEKFWCHINPRSSYCWVCDLLDMVDYIHSILKEIVELDKKNVWKCHRPEGSHDALTFTFKPQPKPRKS